MSGLHWVEVADGVYVRPDPQLLLNCGLVVGEKECLIIDTGSGDMQGQDLARSVREVTALPWRVALTHGHYDHCLGASAFANAPVYAHHGMSKAFSDWVRSGRETTVQELRAAEAYELAESVATATPVVPEHLVTEREVIDLGGRSAVLIPVVPAHTDHDLVVAVPGSGAVFWGDLVEEGSDPDFVGSHPLTWGQAVSTLLDSFEVGLASVNIPGHGSVMTRESVEEQCVSLIRLGDLLSEGVARGEGIPALVARALVCGFGELAVEAAAAEALLTSQV